MVDLSGRDWLLSLAGGGLIGLAAGGLMLAKGRVAGVSGMIKGALAGGRDELLFLAGLPLGALLVGAVLDVAPVSVAGPPWRLALAGLLVGCGARLANGCTSGHGVCGIARLSPRSLAATAVFMAAGMAMVFVVGRP